MGFWAGATHVIGGEMYYDHLGGDQYQITVKLYRDCGPLAQADLPPSILVGVYNGVSNLYLFQQSVNAAGPVQEVPVVLDNPCLSIPPEACVETRTYVGTFALPFAPDGYQLSYQVCCRSASIVNVVNAGEVGLSLLVNIPGSVEENSSPRYLELPPVALCLNEPLVFDHSATDPDADELVYELCAPYLGGSAGIVPGPIPTPSQATAPPYAFIPWVAGFSASDPIPSAPAITIDPVTGLLTLTPSQIGRYVVGVCVSEYRDGVLLSVSRRDFMFQVVPCDAPVFSVIAPQTDFCDDLTIQFVNNSAGANTYQWNFGDPSTTADESTEANPSWTYAEPGSYTVTLITGPGLTCADTTEALFEVYLQPEPGFTPPPALCGVDSITLVSTGVHGPSAVLTWNFGAGGSPSTGAGSTVTTAFAANGAQPVTLSVTENGCTASYTDEVEVYALPTAFFTFAPPSPQPQGATIAFVDASDSNGSTITGAAWDLDGEVLGRGSSWTWEDALPGEHSVTLTVITADGCTASYSIVYVIIPEDIRIPNVFTPNGDAINDQFVIENVQYYANRLSVFNRWGQVVYETTNYRSQWAAKDSPEGTYYYVLVLTESGREFTGHVTVLR